MVPEPPSRPELLAACTAALQPVWAGGDIHLPRQERKAHAEAVAEILEANLANGRRQRVSKASRITEPDLRHYAGRVARHYWAEHERVTGLRAKQPQLWEELHHQLRASAYRTLRTRVGLSHPVALEEANDYAQRACELIFRSRYPWDVPFQAWALRVLFNCIWAQEGRSTDLLDRGSFVEPARQGPDQPSPLEEIGEEPQRLRRWESRDALRDAIRRLTSRAQQRVIVSGFWHGRSSAEIAQELGRTTQAVYNLRHRALNALREILSSQPDLFSR